MPKEISLKFSYLEHDWMYHLDTKEAQVERIVHIASVGEWEETSTTVESDAFETIESLARYAEEVIVHEWGAPSSAAHLAMEKLQRIINSKGWAFKAGDFTEFEGHHNDTEIIVQIIQP
ncbi:MULTISPECIES: hypothetical protein [Streptomyces]|uniref:hypothetical protein n=1 Tax=Streptomyces TaxID=1883 RepID=UPI00131BFA2F|nr:hypothetical protein [Streptomyces virginiae]